MAKGKISNRKQDSMDPSMTRTLRSRKRGYPIEKITVDDHHQDLGEANTEETYVQCNQEGDTQYTELNSSAISDEKNGESETPEVNTADLKRQVETKVKAAVTEMTMKCEPLTREMHISKADPKGDVHSVITKPHDEKASQRKVILSHFVTETEAHLTVSICDALSPNLENYEPTQKPHLDKEQLLNRSETECHYTATLLVADSLCEPQNPELQTTKVQLDSPSGPDPTAELSNTNQKNMMNEQQPLKEIEVTSTDKQHENKHADKDHSHSESCNSKTNPTEKPPIEQELCHQPNTCDKMFLENLYQIIGENSHLIHTSVSDVALETNCNFVDKGHMNSSCAEKEQYDTDTSTENMGPPHSREYVSDSQLNNIDMTDQITDVGTRVSPECYEDVTDLVGGLIRELSSLNRMVMATHRELENLRRRGKTSRNTIR
ncbi:uncharacterized protein si:ch211-286b5.2 isoform X3 [Boleophthalmus pectinirostris]|uniref:uncharacterized protein si:ch211-286b5.2 isoform X3 n=1 Tax=Boleophthalmus pectinirostris TaxID=150288 RepID=UPI00242D72B1|nr:uncharacterized protein si:ch211-286b5.2 isoform X3 [Boleophthalmus pectinirostris]